MLELSRDGGNTPVARPNNSRTLKPDKSRKIMRGGFAMLLTQRNPSQNWEPLALDPSGRFVAWVWFRPPAAPNGLMITVPGTLFVDPQIAAILSIRLLMAATGLDVNQLVGCSVNGMAFDAAAGASPMLDQALPAPGPQGHVQLVVWMQCDETLQPIIQAPVAAMPTRSHAGAVSGAEERSLAAIESCWTSIRQLETKVGNVRKQLDQAMSRLNSLNRDLTPEERRSADNKDTKDWLDARRWLRDSMATISRLTKEIDMGTTSGAGQRHRLEDIYTQFVAPRIPFGGMEQTVIDFDTHAKILQNVVASAQAGLTRAGRDAEQRANGVLSRIAAKSRSPRR